MLHYCSASGLINSMWVSAGSVTMFDICLPVLPKHFSNKLNISFSIKYKSFSYTVNKSLHFYSEHMYILTINRYSYPTNRTKIVNSALLSYKVNRSMIYSLNHLTTNKRKLRKSSSQLPFLLIPGNLNRLVQLGGQL